MVLQNAVPQTTIQHDILIFLKNAFENIRNLYNRDLSSKTPLDRDWPDDKRLQALVDIIVPLFIIATTIYRFVDNFD